MEKTSPSELDKGPLTRLFVFRTHMISLCILIWLYDGKNAFAKLNSLLLYLCRSYPQFSASPFVLMTTFPNRELTQETQTLEEAKLANAVIVQRLK